MKVVAILGGLGSQMFKYAFYLLINRNSEECFIDTSYYLQRKSWNGYELKKLFGIDAPDYVDLLTKNEKEEIVSRKNDYLSVIIDDIVIRKDYVNYYFLGNKQHFQLDIFQQIGIRHAYRLLMHKFYMGLGIYRDYSQEIFEEQNAYFDEYAFNSDKYIKNIKPLLLETFIFPELIDEKNRITAEKMATSNSVAMHVRRTDHLGDNGKLFDRNYYKTCVNYIKNNDIDLHYYIFSDDIKWCKGHISELGLLQHDDITYVNWNNGEKSYLDMQLMTFCKHNVLAISSFSWWGYYLSKRKDKIVCAPNNYWLEVEHHF